MSSDPAAAPIGLGVAGLGRGFMLTLPSLLVDDRIRLVGAAAPRPGSRQSFRQQFGGAAYDSVEALCADPSVEAVYIATPHQLHRDHVEIAARAGKHVLIEKPLAVSLEEGEAMVRAACQAGIQIIVGPSHSFDAPVRQARALIRGGALGRLRMIQAFNYTDFLYRPRRPEELVTVQGGGVLFSQAIHQIDVVRLLAGGLGRSVTAMTGSWDAARPTEGAYAALLDFADGTFASLLYSGYAHFDSDEWMDWVGELGQPKNADHYGAARKALASVRSPEEEAALKSARTFGATDILPPALMSEHFGPIILCCDQGDIRCTPRGLWVYGDTKRRFVETPPQPAPRSGVVDALFAALRQGIPPVQSGAWGLASLEVCHAMLESAQTRRPVALIRQVAAGTSQR